MEQRSPYSLLRVPCDCLPPASLGLDLHLVLGLESRLQHLLGRHDAGLEHPLGHRGDGGHGAGQGHDVGAERDPAVGADTQSEQLVLVVHHVKHLATSAINTKYKEGSSSPAP